jgi:hypothetical protein
MGWLLGRASVEIEAPIERVWAVLTGFSEYGEWNAFTPEVRAEARVGAEIEIVAVLMGMRFVERGRVIAVQAPHMLRWEVFPMHRSLARGDRVQTLEALTAGRCRYTTEDRLSGILALFIALLMRPFVTRGFAKMAEGLKAVTSG